MLNSRLSHRWRFLDVVIIKRRVDSSRLSGQDILLILADAMGYGATLALRPVPYSYARIDSLGRRTAGVRLDEAFITSATECTPTRVTALDDPAATSSDSGGLECSIAWGAKPPADMTTQSDCGEQVKPDLRSCQRPGPPACWR